MIRRFGFALALSFVLGCQTPTPFDAATDCPKEAYCGQCASRGACAWCGDPADSSKGQCVALGHAECAAPAAWSKTPDHCPAPPSASKATASASTSSTSSPTKKAIGAEKYESIRTTLQRAFPHANVTDEAVDGIAEVVMRLPAGPSEPGPGAIPREKAPLTRPVHEKDHRLYLGDATHHRVKSAPPESKPMESQFTLSLPMVRVTLPEKLDENNRIIDTELGDVDLTRDHLLGSIDLIDAKYGTKEYLGARPARVDLITPARSAHARFGAMAVYIGYRNKADRGPWFYMLEAGTATGDAKMIYFSPSMNPIPSVTSYYLPTPFVTMNNTYSGGLTMQPPPHEDEPDQLLVKSYVPGAKDPYIIVTVKYRRAPSFDLPMPIELTADAGARVALIAKTMGISSAVELQPVLAELAKSLHWEQYPRHVAPGASATPDTTATPAPSATPAPPR
ncbi:MAG: hypothetical protein QM820_34130 [Minicystis sp.]